MGFLKARFPDMKIIKLFQGVKESLSGELCMSSRLYNLGSSVLDMKFIWLSFVGNLKEWGLKGSKDKYPEKYFLKYFKKAIKYWG